MKTQRPWTVLPHGTLDALEPNLRVVEGRLPRGNLSRRMMAARLSDGRLVFHNAIPLAEPEMKSLESWGKPAILFVPNGWHRLDIHAYKQRYPQLTVLCPEQVRRRVAEVIPVDGGNEDFPADPDVQLISLRGTKTGEALLKVQYTNRVSLCFGDVFMNIVQARGFDGFVLRLLGSVGGPRVTSIARMMVVKDKKVLRVHLEELSHLPGLYRLIPSHGDVVNAEAPAVLRRVAERLH